MGLETLTLLSIGATAVAGVGEFQAGRAAAKAEKIAAQERSAEFKLQAQQEKTQAATEASDRERRLQRALASQRAAFAGAGVDFSSGSPLVIQQQTAGEINREGRISELRSGLAVSNLNRQSASTLRAGETAASARRFGATVSLIKTGSRLGQLGADFRDIQDRKKNSGT